MPKAAVQSKPTTNNLPIDKRAKNGNKIDILRVVNLRDINKLSFAKIGQIVGYSQSMCHKAYHDFFKMFPDVTSQEVKVYAENKPTYMHYAEYVTLQKMMDEKVLSKASFNNLSYGHKNLHEINRLESGQSTAGGITVSIEVAYQEASQASKDMRLKHAGSSSTTPMDTTSADRDSD